MRPATLEFLRQRFAQYYRRGYLAPPPALGEREWGFILFDPAFPEIRMIRHMGFGGKRELIDYLRGVVPAHAFHSAAYYASPSAPTMAEKGWTGADLIFDLDADHIMRGPYDQMLARVKEETLKLLRMLTEELGMDPRTMEVVFSGGRGYHVHIRDLALRGWGSQERRELIDYVCGTGIESRAMYSQPKQEGATGWRSRYQETVQQYLTWLRRRPEEAIEHLSTLDGVSRQGAVHLLKRLETMDEPLTSSAVGVLLRSRTLPAVLTEGNAEFQRRLREKAALADEPVTTDTRRLIRMPTSLHGGSGMRVTPLTFKELERFDPLIDAVVFGDRGVSVESNANLSHSMLGNSYKFTRGEISSIPEAVAVFLCCRGMAEIAGGS
jgi:DNA primase small subunit